MSTQELSRPVGNRPVNEGTAYGRVPGHHNAKLTEVGSGTPGGEYLRRYWHPIAFASDVGRRPQKVRVLAEDLILFRDGKDRLGLLYPRCSHRGTNLFYGKTEERGIRCCYHGWLFDTEGRCLEQPCEKDGGRERAHIRQPWYPVQERYGLVFAYLGPPDRMPVLPRIDIFEDLPPGHSVFPHGGPGMSGYADTAAAPGETSVPYNWFQTFENGVDPFHVWTLHSTFSGFPQFGESYTHRPQIEFEATETSILNHAIHAHDGVLVDQVEELVLPNIKALFPMNLAEKRGRRISWVTPIDDTSFVYLGATAGPERLVEFDALVMTPDGKSWSQMSEA